jgi:hypothetical protein
LAWLALPGLLHLARAERGAGLLLAGLCGILLGVYSGTVLWQPRGDPPGWWAGTTWGPRYLQPLLPCLALAAAAWAAPHEARPARRRPAFLALAALGVVISWNGILFDFVAHYRWLHGTLGLPWTGVTEFQVWASPLVSGWISPARAWDLFWLLDSGLVRPLAELAAQARDDLGLELGPASRTWGFTIPAFLLMTLAWAMARIRALLR